MAYQDADAVPAKGPEGKLAQIIRRFTQCVEHEHGRRKQGEKCAKYYLGDQWDPEIKKRRTIDKRPCLTLNRIPEFVAQVVNEFRSQRPEIRISSQAEGDEARETAEVLEDYVRFLQRRSDANLVYDVGFQNSVIRKVGWARVRLDWAGEGDEQDIFLDPVYNPDSVYCDPAAQRDDASDARFMFVATDMPKDEFLAEYPNSEVGSTHFQAEGDLMDWVQASTVRVVEYFSIQEENVTQRKPVRTVKWCKTNGVEILAESVFPGERIPLIRLMPDRVDLNGRTHSIGMVDNAIEPQDMLNYWATKATEAIALAPVSPYLATPEQIQGFEQIWKMANEKNYPYLPYNAVDVKGHLLGQPQRQQFEPPIQGMVQMFAMMDQSLKSAMRIYNAGLGDTGPERSGRAILAQKQQTNMANMNYGDNAARWIRSIGQFIVDLIPLVISGPRLVAALAMDGADRMVWLNKPFRKGAVEKIYDVTTAKFYVHVHTGPTYETKRQEAAAAMIEMAKADPTLMQIAGDLMIGAMDWPGADKVAERKKKTLPPALQDQEEGEEIPAQAQAMLQALQQQQQQLTQALQATTEELEKQKAANESRESISAADNATKLQVEQMRLDLEREKMQMEFQIKQQELAQMQMEFQIKQRELALQMTKVEADMEKAKMAAAAKRSRVERGEEGQITGIGDREAEAPS